MLLAIDVGNTHVVLGLYLEEELVANWRLRSDRHRTVDEFALEIITLIEHASIENPKCSRSNIKSVILSCVVPPLSRVFTKLSQKYFQIEPLIVGPGIKTGMKISCDDPRSVGADRIVNAVACKELVGTPGIVVDFGTATTFDVIDAEGVYVGGLISPGVVISAQALFDRAAMLPSIEIKRPQSLIGRNTHDSMVSGIFYGYAAMVQGILDKLGSELGEDVKVIATGGLATALAEEIKAIDTVIPELTLEGLRMIANYNIEQSC